MHPAERRILEEELDELLPDSVEWFVVERIADYIEHREKLWHFWNDREPVRSS